LVVPEGRSSKLYRLTPRKIVNPEVTEKDETAERQMRQEMLAETEKDGAALK
jgi:hypothetical protein